MTITVVLIESVLLAHGDPSRLWQSETRRPEVTLHTGRTEHTVRLDDQADAQRAIEQVTVRGHKTTPPRKRRSVVQFDLQWLA